MAISKRGATSTAFTNLSAGGSISITLPASIANNDVCYIGVSTGATTTAGNAATVIMNTPAGWTKVGQGTGFMLTQTFTSNICLYRKVCNGTEGGTSVTFTNPGTVTGTNAFGELHAIDWIGVDTTTPEDCALTNTDAITYGGGSGGTGGSGTWGQTTKWPTQTTVTNGAQIMAWESLWDATSFTTPTGAGSPASYSFEYDGGGTSSSNGSGLLGCWLGSQTTAGATGEVTRLTNGNASNNQTSVSNWSSLLVSLRPSSGAAAASMLPINVMQQRLTQLLAR